jgi:hypothetical protein
MNDNGNAAAEGEDTPLTIKAAENKLNELFQTNKWQRLFNTIASVAVIIALVASGFLVYGHFKLTADEVTLRTNAISSCQNGNAFRSGQTEIWDSSFTLQAAENKATASLLASLINTLAQNNPAEIAQIKEILVKSDAAQTAEQAKFLKNVAKINMTRDCVEANTTPSATAGS